MKPVALAGAALALIAVAIWTVADAGPRSVGPAGALPAATPAAAPDRPGTPPSRLDRAAVQRQRDLGARQSRRARRMRLLAVARARPWITHGVALVAGSFAFRTRTQPILVTPTPTGPTGVSAIGRAVRTACTQLHDPCRASDYQFLLMTRAGTVALPVPGSRRSGSGGTR